MRYLEPRQDFQACEVGVYSSRVVYDYHKLVEVLVEQFSVSHPTVSEQDHDKLVEEVEDYIDYNILGSLQTLYEVSDLPLVAQEVLSDSTYNEELDVIVISGKMYTILI